MGFRRSDLQEAFFVPGTLPFRVYGYGTSDALEEVLRPNYFAAAGALLLPGELIYISAGRPSGSIGAEPGEVHMALVMVRTGERGAPSVRLVQDFGRPDDPDAVGDLGRVTAPTAVPAPPAPVKRGRGRPPGSRSRKNGALPAMAVN